MRAFALFFVLMLLSLAAIAAFSYPVWLLLHPHFDFPFHRMGERIGMLALLVGFALLASRFQLADRVSLGYGLPRHRFVRELLLALALGVASMLLIVALMSALGLLGWSAQRPDGAAGYTHIIGSRLLSGIAVGFIEETMLRGAMFTAIARESGPRAAIILTSIVYSATHFFASYHIAPDHVNAQSGVVLLQGTLQAFAAPQAIADAFLCLCGVGIVLGIIRALTGNIAACIGLHAGWVWVMLVAHDLTVPLRGPPLGFLLSRFDGFVGWLVLACTLPMGLLLYRLYARRAGA